MVLLVKLVVYFFLVLVVVVECCGVAFVNCGLCGDERDQTGSAGSAGTRNSLDPVSPSSWWAGHLCSCMPTRTFFRLHYVVVVLGKSSLAQTQRNNGN